MEQQVRMPTPVVAILHLDHGRVIIQKLHNSHIHDFEIWQEHPQGFESLGRTKELGSALDRVKAYVQFLDESKESRG